MSTAVLIAVLLAVRLVIIGLRHAGSEAPSPETPPVVRGSVVLWAIALPLAVILSVVVASGQWQLLPVAILLWVLVFPWPAAALLLIPMGAVRPAHALASLAAFMFSRDRKGGAALAAAWALVRRGGARAGSGEAVFSDAEWIEGKLKALDDARGAAVVARGLLCLARGDPAGARVWLESVEHMDERAVPEVARKVACEWLAADAAAHGDWQAVERIASAAGAPRSRLTRLLGSIAAHLLGTREVGSIELWGLWLVAPRRRATIALVRRALGSARGVAAEAPVGSVEALIAADADSLSRALGLMAVLSRRLARGERSAVGGDRVFADGDLRRLAEAWDAALADPALASSIARRAAELGARQDRALGALASEAERTLVEIALASRVPLSDLGKTGGPVVQRAARRLRDQLLGEIETATEALRRRAEEKRALPPLDEWREWLAIREQLERAGAVGGLELRRLAFPKVHGDLSKLAVWLYNERRIRPVANAIFRWARDEARALGDVEAAELEEKNVACGV